MKVKTDYEACFLIKSVMKNVSKIAMYNGDALEKAQKECEEYCKEIIANYDEMIDGALSITESGRILAQFASYEKNGEIVHVVDVFERKEIANSEAYDINNVSINGADYMLKTKSVFYTYKAAREFYQFASSPDYHNHELKTYHRARRKQA
jgi:ABC-type glycerol-3-phosphate transport system substrate-binding protein